MKNRNVSKNIYILKGFYNNKKYTNMIATGLEYRPMHVLNNS